MPMARGFGGRSSGCMSGSDIVSVIPQICRSGAPEPLVPLLELLRRHVLGVADRRAGAWLPVLGRAGLGQQHADGRGEERGQGGLVTDAPGPRTGRR